MPKRIVDGEKLWTSSKLKNVQPASFRPEYANLIPLALANGSFECDPDRIFATVYATNRPDWKKSKVEKLLRELERVHLLFRWKDTATGKWWGYFVGIDKAGRLPPESDRRSKRYEIGIEPPKRELEAYLRGESDDPTSRHCREAIEPILTCEADPIGEGIGTGAGIGIGEGIGTGVEDTHTDLIPAPQSVKPEPSTALPDCYQLITASCSELGFRPEPRSYDDVWGFVRVLEEKHGQQALMSDFEAWLSKHKDSLLEKVTSGKNLRPVGEWSQRASFRIAPPVQTPAAQEFKLLCTKIEDELFLGAALDQSARDHLRILVKEFSEVEVLQTFEEQGDEICNSLDLAKFIETLDRRIATLRRRTDRDQQERSGSV